MVRRSSWPERRAGSTTVVRRQRIGNIARWGLMGVTLAAAVWVVVMRDTLLPAKYSYDANHIQQVAQGTIAPEYRSDRKLAFAGGIYRLLGLSDQPLLAGMLGLALFLVCVVLVARTVPQSIRTWRFAIVASVGCMLAAVYLGQYSKDVVVLVIVIVALLVPGKLWAELTVLVCAGLYGMFGRDYWLVVAVVGVILWIALKRIKVLPVLALSLALLMIASILISIRFGAADHFRLVINADREGAADAVTLIPNVFEGAQPWSGLANNLICFATLILPVPLLFVGQATYVGAALLLAALWLATFASAIALYRRGQPVYAAVPRAVALLLAMVAAQALFEPDYGSVLRHLTPLVPLMLLIITDRRVGGARWRNGRNGTAPDTGSRIGSDGA